MVHFMYSRMEVRMDYIFSKNWSPLPKPSQQTSFWGRGPTSRPSCVWKFNHFTNLRESTTQSYRKDDGNGVNQVEQLWFTGNLWKSIKTCWTYGSSFSSLLYFHLFSTKTNITHRLGQGENGEMFPTATSPKHPSASRSCCCARSWPWMLEGVESKSLSTIYQ